MVSTLTLSEHFHLPLSPFHAPQEVAVWGAYFNAFDPGWQHGDLNARTVDSILGYMAANPTWVFNGAAYGMCDFSNKCVW